MKFKSINLIISIVSLVLGSMLFVSGTVAGDKAVVLGDVTVITATVVGIDRAGRVVTLQGPRGNIVNIEAGEEVRNFDQINVGDQVKVNYYQSVALYIGPPGSHPQASATAAMARAPKGAMPGGVMVHSVDVAAVVKAIDKKTRKLTLELPDGNDVTTVVDPAVKAFDSLKVGDSINARMTRAVAIGVVAP